MGLSGRSRHRGPLPRLQQGNRRNMPVRRWADARSWPTTANLVDLSHLHFDSTTVNALNSQ